MGTLEAWLSGGKGKDRCVPDISLDEVGMDFVRIVQQMLGDSELNMACVRAFSAYRCR